MGEPGVTEAVISIDSDGRYLDANLAALALLGVTLAELRTSSGDRFSLRPPEKLAPLLKRYSQISLMQCDQV